MSKEAYKKQAALMLSVLPEVANETCFAIHGGTAINLFVREMPRLSVDIDLTYLPLQDRATSLAGIVAGLETIKSRLERVLPHARVILRKDIGKLLISTQGVDIKLEVNLVARGTLARPVQMALCKKAQDEFEAFCSIQVVPFGQLYGGKICAALDRQHPRDLFDVKHLLENEGISNEVKEGFLLCLVGTDRPISEVVLPNFQDQRAAMDNQFAGMSAGQFTYEDFERTRETLVKDIHRNLTDKDKEFLLSVKSLTPDWSIYDFSRFPAVMWKLQNLEKLKQQNPDKHREQYEALGRALNGG